MKLDNLIKLMLVIIIISIIYFRNHYYLLVIAVLVFLAYKFGLYQKVYKVLNKISGNTQNVVADKNKKKRFLSKLRKNNGSEM